MLHDGLELRGRGLVLLRSKERPAERLADRGLVRSEVRGPPQGHCGGVVIALLEQLRPRLEEVVDVVHPTPMIGAVPAIASALRKRRGVVLATCAETAARAAAPTGCGSGRAARRRRRAHAGARRAPSGRARAASRRSASWPAGAGIPPPRSRRTASRVRAASCPGAIAPAAAPQRAVQLVDGEGVGSPRDASRADAPTRAHQTSAVPPPTSRRHGDHHQQRRAPAGPRVVDERRRRRRRRAAGQRATLGDGGRRRVAWCRAASAAASSSASRPRAGESAGVGSNVTQPMVGKYASTHECASMSRTTISPRLSSRVPGREAGGDPRGDAAHAQQERHRPGELLAVAGLLVEQERVERDVGARGVSL